MVSPRIITVVKFCPLKRASSVAARPFKMGNVASVELCTTPADRPSSARSDSYSFTIFWRPTAATISIFPSRLAWRIQEITASSASKGKLFFNRQRSIGRASLALRGKVSNGRMNTRMLGSGKSSATSVPCRGTRSIILRIAVRTESRSTMLGCVAEGVTAPSGSRSAAYETRFAKPRPQRAAATCVCAISSTTLGCGIASSQVKSFFPPLSGVARDGVAVRLLVNERHLVNFTQRGDSCAHARDSRFAQKLHALFFRGAFYFRARTAVDNHLANAIREIQQLGNRRATAKTGTRAIEAASSFVEWSIAPLLRIDSRLAQRFGRVSRFLLAVRANHAH